MEHWKIILIIVAVIAFAYWYYETKIGNLTFTPAETPNPVA